MTVLVVACRAVAALMRLRITLGERRFALAGAMACAVLMLSAPARAASQTDRDQCADVGNRAAVDQNIAACTRMYEFASYCFANFCP